MFHDDVMNIQGAVQGTLCFFGIGRATCPLFLATIETKPVPALVACWCHQVMAQAVTLSRPAIYTDFFGIYRFFGLI